MRKYIIPASRGVQGNAKGQRYKNDCVIRAIANTHPTMTYDDAYAAVKDIFTKRGTLVGPMCERLPKNGYKLLGIHGTTKLATWASKANSEVPYMKGMTLKNFMSLVTEGTYLLMVNGHSTVVKDGKLIDSTAVPENAYVALVWEYQGV